MSFEPKSIEHHIECLARLTGASEAFIDQVKSLFLKKGIALDSEAEPYIRALEEAFRREESIRASSQRARENLSQINERFSKMGRNYVRNVRRMKQVQEDLHDRTRKLQKGSGKAKTTHTVTIQGDHRSFITRPEREELPMVPGPDGLQ